MPAKACKFRCILSTYVEIYKLSRQMFHWTSVLRFHSWVSVELLELCEMSLILTTKLWFSREWFCILLRIKLKIFPDWYFIPLNFQSPGVCLSFYLSVSFSHFHSIFENHRLSINQTCGKKHPWWKRFQIKGYVLE